MMEIPWPFVLPLLLMYAFWLGIWIERRTRSQSAIELVYEEAKKSGADKLVVDLKDSRMEGEKGITGDEWKGDASELH